MARLTFGAAAPLAMTLTALSSSAAVCAADKEQVVGDGGRILATAHPGAGGIDAAENAAYQNARDFYWRGATIAQRCAPAARP